MSNNIQISFCIPTYNRASYIARCIESVLAYTGDDIEVVVLDNKSTDDTLEIIQGYKDPRLIIKQNELNIGARANIRKILNFTTGKYCFYLTDDDMIYPGAIPIIKSFIKEYEPDVFSGDFIVYLEKSGRASISSPILNTKSPSQMSIEDRANLFIRSHVLTSICFRKDKLDFDFYDENIDLWYPSLLIIASMNNNMGYIKSPIAIHIWENELFWGNNSSSNELYDSYMNGLFILQNKFSKDLFRLICIKTIFNEGKYDKRFNLILGKILVVKIKIELNKRILIKKIKILLKRFLNFF